MVKVLGPLLAGAKVSFKMLRAELAPALYVSVEIPGLVMRIAFFYLVARFAGGPGLGQFALIGNAVQAINLAIMVPVSNVIYMERTSGNLTLLLVTPSNKIVTILGRTTASFAEGIAKCLMVLFMMGPVTGLSLHVLGRALCGVPILLLIAVSTTGLALAVACLSFTLRVDLTMASMSAGLLMVLGGVNVPLEALPKPLATLGMALPLTRGLLAFRAVLAGASYVDVVRLIAGEALVGLGYLVVGCLLFSLQISRARNYGTDFA